MDRRDKIKLLKKLANGETTLQGLQPKELLHKVGYPGDKFFINGRSVSQETYLNAVEMQVKNGTFRNKGISYGPDEPVFD